MHGSVRLRPTTTESPSGDRRAVTPSSNGRPGHGSRLAIALTAALVVTAIALPLWATTWASRRAEGAVRDRAVEGQVAVARTIGEQSSHAFDMAVQAVVSSAARPSLTDAVTRGDATQAALTLSNVASLVPFSLLAVYDGSGALLAAYPINAPARPRVEPVAEPAVVGPRVVDGKVLATVSAPVGTVGTLVADFDFASLFSQDKLVYGTRGVITLADQSGLILASGQSEAVGLPLLAPEALADARGRAPAVSRYFAPRVGFRVISAFVPVEDQAWGALVVAPEDETYAPVDALRRRLATGGVAFGGAGAAVAVAAALIYLSHERRLRQTERELRAANADLGVFAAVAAHDLRAPLGTVLGYTELLLHDPALGDEHRRQVEAIDRRGRSMTDLITDLLAYAAAGHDRALEDVEVAAAFAAAGDNVAGALEARHAVVTGPAPGVRVRADRGQLTQLLQNLLANAVLYCPGDRRPDVVVTAEADDGHVTICVGDNGDGIDPADAPRLLRPFERGADRAPGTGTGLGLAIVQRVVDGHGGTLTIGRSPLGGAEFRVRFSRPPAAPPARRR